MKKRMSDSQIMRQRGKLYGDPDLMWQTIGRLHRTLDDYFREVHGDTIPSDEHEAHLSCLKQSMVKVVRSIVSPEHRDNYCDSRNYISIAENIVNGK